MFSNELYASTGGLDGNSSEMTQARRTVSLCEAEKLRGAWGEGREPRLQRWPSSTDQRQSFLKAAGSS